MQGLLHLPYDTKLNRYCRCSQASHARLSTTADQFEKYTMCTCGTIMSTLYLDRAVATGPVSPISTGPLFPLLVACPWPWHCQLAPLLGAGHPHNVPKHIGIYHVETCEMAANSATELFCESSNNFPFLQVND